jgi:hypothetical protein
VPEQIERVAEQMHCWQMIDTKSRYPKSTLKINTHNQ